MTRLKLSVLAGRISGRFASVVAGLLVCLGSVGAAPPPAPAPDVEIWRMDCGRIQNDDLDAYSDTFAQAGKAKEFTVSCYLVRNGDRYLLWDTGLPVEFLGKQVRDDIYVHSLDRRLTDQLREIGIAPDRVEFLGLSHYHYDHTGQAADFSQATLLVDKRDWEVIKGRDDLAAPLEPWTAGSGKSEMLTSDKDVFGDGAVVMLRTPGHTPGHRSLLVRLKDRGPVLLTGDVAHFRENWVSRGVPTFNTSRAESLASMDRLRQMADVLGAAVIIGHEPQDVSRLAAFPASSH